MYYIYDTHLGEIEIKTEEKYSLYCENCNDYDRLIGTAEDVSDVYRIIKEKLGNYYNDEYILNTIAEACGNVNLINVTERSFYRKVFKSKYFAELMRKYLIKAYDSMWYIYDEETDIISFDTGSHHWSNAIRQSLSDLGCDRYYTWYYNLDETETDIVDGTIGCYLASILFDEFGNEVKIIE